MSTYSIYTQAIRHHPDLDVALANLASALKDTVSLVYIPAHPPAYRLLGSPMGRHHLLSARCQSQSSIAGSEMRLD